MKGLKFLFKREFCHTVLNIISIVFMLVMMVAVVIAHEPVGAEDYIMCKVGAHLGVMLSVMFNLILLCSDVTGNRLMRSAPFSKQLKRFSIPAYCVILGGGRTVLINIAYAIFCIVSGLDMSHLSDMLIVSSPLMLCLIIMGTIALNINYGMILVIYIIFPVMGLVSAIPSNAWEFGFGLPIWAGALIFVGTLAVSIAAAFIIGRIFHEKVDFKPIQQNATYVK